MKKLLCLLILGLLVTATACSSSDENSYNLAANQLRGNVSNLKIDNSSYQFDEKGALEFATIGRRLINWRKDVKETKKGNTVIWDIADFAKWTCTFDDQKRLIRSQVGQSQDTQYTYEGDSFLPVSISGTNPETGELLTLKYVYDSIDEHGNWIRSHFEGYEDEISTREITYYSSSEVGAGAGFIRFIGGILKFILLGLLWSIFGISIYGYYRKRQGLDNEIWLQRLLKAETLFLLVSLVFIFLMRLDPKWMVRENLFGWLVMAINLAGGLAMLATKFSWVSWDYIKQALQGRRSGKERWMMICSLLTTLYLGVLIFFTTLSIAIIAVVCIGLYYIISTFVLNKNSLGGDSSGPQHQCCSSCRRFSNGFCNDSPGEKILDPDRHKCGNHTF